MIVEPSNGREYPTGIPFKVKAWTLEKLKKNIRNLNSNLNIILNLMQIVSFGIFEVVSIYLQILLGVPTILIIIFEALLNYQRSMELFQQIFLMLKKTKLRNSNTNSFSSFLIKILPITIFSFLTPILAIIHAKLLKRLLFLPSSDSLIKEQKLFLKSQQSCNRNSQAIFMLQILVIIWVICSLSGQLQESSKITRITFACYFYICLIGIQNTLFIQVKLICTLILQNNISANNFWFFQFRSNKYKRITNQPSNNYSKITNLLSNSHFFTYLENLSQTSQNIILFFIFGQNSLMKTIFIAIQCIYLVAVFSVQKNQKTKDKSKYDLSYFMDFFLGYKMDYVCSIMSLNFKQLKKLHSDRYFFKVYLIILLRGLMIILGIISIEKEGIFCVLFFLTILFDIICIIAKLPAYKQIFLERSTKSNPFTLSVHTLDIQKFTSSHLISPLSQIINVIITQPLASDEINLLSDILIEISNINKTVYFESSQQLIIYSKFGHCEIILIQPIQFIYNWAFEILSKQVKSIKIKISLQYHNQSEIIKLAKDQLVAIAFDASNKFAFTNNEIINCLPCGSFHKHSLEELTLEYSREKIVSQFCIFKRHIQQYLLNSPQQVLYDLFEIS